MVTGPPEHAAHVRAYERGQAHAGPGGERLGVPKAAHENGRRAGEGVKGSEQKRLLGRFCLIFYDKSEYKSHIIFIYYPELCTSEEKMKTLQEIESILRDQKPILRQRFKVKEIGIFGSFARGEQKDTSDLDLLIDFEEPIGLIRYVGLQNYLSDEVGERVDLVTKSGLKPRISGHILKEVIYV